MNQGNVFPADRYPPTSALAAAIRQLPRAGLGVPPQTAYIDAGSVFGRFSVTFVVRLNAEREPHRWFWGVADSARIADDAGRAGSGEPVPSLRRNILVLTRGSASGKPPASIVAIGILNKLQQIWTLAAPVIGPECVVALYARSRHLSSRSHPWLTAPEYGHGSGMDLDALRSLVAQQDGGEAAAGAGFLLKSFHDLLAGMVGALLAGELMGEPSLLEFGSRPA